MKAIAHFFFFTYVGLVVVAGFWGAFLNPVWDFDFLFSLDVKTLSDFERINLLSQYRFLRGLELGFGIFSLYFFKKIFSEIVLHRLFLTIMGLGILARIFSWLFDGNPGLLTKFFLIYEATGWCFIFGYGKLEFNSNAHQS